MAETVKDIEVAGKLDEIGQTLKRSFGLQKATLSAVQDQGKPSVREKATKGLDEDVGLAKPKSTGADVGKAKGASDAAKAGSKGFISGFLKYFGLIGLGIFLKDEIGGFIKGAFGSLKDLVMEWWKGKFLPALQELDKAINPFSDEEGLFGPMITKVKEFAEEMGKKVTELFTSFDNFTKEFLGFSIKDLIMGEEGEGGERSGGLMGYINKVGDGFIQFGKSIGLLDDKGDFSFGATVGLGAIGASILAIKGPGGIIKSLFGAFKSVTSGLLSIGGKVLTAPFKLLGGAAKGLKNLITGPATKSVKDAAGIKAAAPRTGMNKVAENFERGKTASDKQLKKAGLIRGTDGALTDKSGKTLKADELGKRLDDAKVKGADKLGKASTAKLEKMDAEKAVKAQKAPDIKPPAKGGGGSAPKGGGSIKNKIGEKFGKLATKYPKLFGIIKFLKGIPGLGAALTVAPLIAAIAMGKGPKEIAPLAGALIGGVLGFKGGALLGGMIGAAGGPVALVTAALGGIGGALLGDSLGTSIAQTAMGLEADGMPWGFGWVDDILNGMSGGGDSKSASGGEPKTAIPTATASEPSIPDVSAGSEAGAKAGKVGAVESAAMAKDAQGGAGGEPIMINMAAGGGGANASEPMPGGAQVLTAQLAKEKMRTDASGKFVYAHG